MSFIHVSNIKVEIVRKNIKNINLSVRPPDGSVRVSAPNKVTDDIIHTFVTSKIDWIEKHQNRIRLRNIKPEKKFTSGEKHYFQGKAYELRVFKTTSKQHVILTDNHYLDLYMRRNSTREKREKVMMDYYRAHLKEATPLLIAKWEPKMNVTVYDWGVKKMKTRWGTCNTAAKRIWISLEVAKKHPCCLEYIVVHEMVHLLERLHNKRFYNFMDQFLPNWREVDKELNLK